MPRQKHRIARNSADRSRAQRPPCCRSLSRYTHSLASFALLHVSSLRLRFLLRTPAASVPHFHSWTTSLRSPATPESRLMRRPFAPLHRSGRYRSTSQAIKVQNKFNAACSRNLVQSLVKTRTLSLNNPRNFSKNSRTARTMLSLATPETPTATTKSEITPSPAARHPPTPCLPTGRGLRLAFRHPVMYVSVLLGEGVFRFPAMRKFTACRRRISA